MKDSRKSIKKGWRGTGKDRSQFFQRRNLKGGDIRVISYKLYFILLFFLLISFLFLFYF